MDIVHHFPINESCRKTFQAVSTPAGLDAWWTETSGGDPGKNSEYELGFGPGYDWRAVVSRYRPSIEFELTMTRAQEDWQGTRVNVVLEENAGVTQVRFRHSGWAEASDHYYTSCYCWAMYLRLLKRFVEYGERVPYADRLEV